MDWIKRNLYFLIGAGVAVALMGLAGFFLYTRWQQNNQAMEQLNGSYDTLRQLNSQNPHPGAGDVDNIKLAKEETEQLKALIKKARGQFQPILPIPEYSNPTNLTDREFSAALARTLEQLGRDATNASVTIPPNYYFSFGAQHARVNYAAGSLPLLATQLGEVKAICDVLFAAKVNSLDGIRREKVSTDDQVGMQTDYLEKKSVTNELAILSPYEVNFRCFSPELAMVLAGFSTSPHGLLVRAVNVELAPASSTTDQQQTQPVPVYTPVMVPQASGAEPAASSMDQAFMRRYGIDPRGGRRPMPGQNRPMPAAQPQPVYVPQPGTAVAAPSKGGLQTVLDEKQLKVNLVVYVVKLIPPQQDGR